MPFDRNIWKNIGKNKGKNLSSKYSQKPVGHPKQSATDSLKSISKRAIQKTAEGSDDLIDNKTADVITKLSSNSSQTSSVTVESETGNSKFYKKIPKGRYIYISRKKAASY